jgi:hypothetical protein
MSTHHRLWCRRKEADFPRDFRDCAVRRPFDRVLQFVGPAHRAPAPSTAPNTLVFHNLWKPCGNYLDPPHRPRRHPACHPTSGTRFSLGSSLQSIDTATSPGSSRPGSWATTAERSRFGCRIRCSRTGSRSTTRSFSKKRSKRSIVPTPSCSSWPPTKPSSCRLTQP